MSIDVKILILDDEPIVCDRLKPALEKEGYKVEVYTDSSRAKERVAEHRFDIIVTDLKMSNIDGMQLFEFVKEKWPDTEVIIITGFATVEITREALKSGVRDVIAKPFKIAYLKDLINKLVAEITEGK